MALGKSLVNVPTVDEIAFNDFVIIVKDGCVKKISYEDFVTDIILGGSSICDAWLACVSGIGTIQPPIDPTDKTPIMGDLIFNPNNRLTNFSLTAQMFLDQYYDEDGDALFKLIIAGGDTSGFTLGGNPINIGQTILLTELPLVYNAKDQDASYQGVLLFDAYDINNVKAL